MNQRSQRTEIKIGGRIRELRQERGMTLDQLAAQAGISASHLSRLERDQAEPSFTVAAAIAQQIGVSLSELLPNGPSAS